MHIRPYTASDRPAITAHIVDFQDHHAALEEFFWPGTEVCENYMSYLLAKCENGQILVAEEDEKIVGYICFCCEETTCVNFPVELWIIDIYLIPECRGKGFGRIFLGKAEEFARERSLPRLMLKVLARNESAREMYEKNGFRDYEITMVRDL